MAIGTSRAGVLADATLVDRTRHQTALRLLPFLFVLYIVNYLDRTQRRVCGDRNVSRPGVQRPRVWPGRGRVLYRLPGAADSGVAAGGELERAENDSRVDGGVGIADGADGPGAYSDAALPGAIFAGAGGGELFSGGDGLCEPLVHPERQGEGGEQLHGGDSAVVDDWVAVGGMDCRAPLAGVRGLAVAVCAGGNAGSGTGRDRVSLAAGLAEGCGVALARAARVDYTRIGVGEASGTTRRVGAGDAAVGASAVAGGGVISGLPAGVCGDLLDTDAAEAPDGVVRCAGGVAAGDSVRSGAGGDAVQRMAFGQAVGAALAHRGSAAAGGAGGGGAAGVSAVAGDDAVSVQPDDGRVGLFADILGDPNGDSKRHGGCWCVGSGEHDREYCGLLRAVGVWVPAHANWVAGERVYGDGGVLGGVGGADADDSGAAAEGAACRYRGAGYLRRKIGDSE